MPFMVRKPAVAGLFYPDDSDELRATVHARMAAAEEAAGNIDDAGRPPLAIIAPHAGFVYSGPVAASAYKTLPRDGSIRRVVLIGPAHRSPVRSLAVPRWTHFRTPLGDVPVCRQSLKRLLALPFVDVDDRAHGGEHSLEVHLPFLQMTLGEFELVPIVNGAAQPEQVAEAFDLVADEPGVLIVVSSDLSHYLDYDAANTLDRRTAASIVALAGEELGQNQACGRHAIKGLLLHARRRNLEGSLLDLRNSGDTSGPKNRVVGYGAFRFDSAAT